MTVTYTLRVSNARLLGFSKLLLTWRGGIYKLVYKEMLIFISLYASLSLVYRLVLDDAQKRVFEMMVRHFGSFLDVIPLTFVLGFYVSIITKRWWDQFKCIPWPDNLLSHVGVYISGGDERGRLIRRSIMRWVNLSSALIFQSISLPVKKRFPTLQHLVDAGLMTPQEKTIFRDVPSAHSKYWVPCMWCCTLANHARQEGRIKDDILLKSIVDELNTYKSNLGLLYCYDWISIPLVYTQVATLAVYTFCLTSLMGRQYTEPTGATPSSHELDIYVPVFTLLQFFFYMGWLKVAEVMINPFGEDADDFEINRMIDRNYQVSMLAVDGMYGHIPPLEKDIYWDDPEPELPYTRSTLPNKFESYMGSTADFSLNGENTELVMPMETIPENAALKPTTFLNASTTVNSAASSPEKSRRFFNNIFSSMSQVDMEALPTADGTSVNNLRTRIKEQIFGQSPLLDRIKHAGFHGSSSNFDHHDSSGHLGLPARAQTNRQSNSHRLNRQSVISTIERSVDDAAANADKTRSNHANEHGIVHVENAAIHVFEPQTLSNSPLISMLEQKGAETNTETTGASVLDEGLEASFSKLKANHDCEMIVVNEEKSHQSESQSEPQLVERSNQSSVGFDHFNQSNIDAFATLDTINQSNVAISNFTVPTPDIREQGKCDIIEESHKSTANFAVSFVESPMFYTCNDNLKVSPEPLHQQFGYVTHIPNDFSHAGGVASLITPVEYPAARINPIELAISSESEKVQEFLNTFVSPNPTDKPAPVTADLPEGTDVDVSQSAGNFDQANIRDKHPNIVTNPFCNISSVTDTKSLLNDAINLQNVPGESYNVSRQANQQSAINPFTDSTPPHPFDHYRDNHVGLEELPLISHQYPHDSRELKQICPQVDSITPLNSTIRELTQPLVANQPNTSNHADSVTLASDEQSYILLNSDDQTSPRFCTENSNYNSAVKTIMSATSPIPIHSNPYTAMPDVNNMASASFASASLASASLASTSLASASLASASLASINSVSTEDNLSDASTEESCLSLSELESPYGSLCSAVVLYDTPSSETALLEGYLEHCAE